MSDVSCWWQGWAMFLTTGTSTTMLNTSIIVGSIQGSQSDATLIYTSGAAIDYGNCTPGTTPGEAGNAIYVATDDFRGCPYTCPAGNYGPGGSNSYLRGITSLCSVGCKTCPDGAVCPKAGLGAPEVCSPGHYNPDTGSQDASSCRSCETGKYQVDEGSTACVACSRSPSVALSDS